MSIHHMIRVLHEAGVDWEIIVAAVDAVEKPARDAPDIQENRRRPIPDAAQMAAFQKTDGRCFYCGIETVSKIKWERLGKPAGIRVQHIDHVHPVSRGGTNNPDNLVVACQRCNTQKRDKTVEEYREYMGLINGSERHIFYCEEMQ